MNKFIYPTISEWRGIPLPPVEGYRWVIFVGTPALTYDDARDFIGWVTEPKDHTHGDGWLAHKDNNLRGVFPTAEEAIAVLAMWVTLGVTA